MQDTPKDSQDTEQCTHSHPNRTVGPPQPGATINPRLFRTVMHRCGRLEHAPSLVAITNDLQYLPKSNPVGLGYIALGPFPHHFWSSFCDGSSNVLELCLVSEAGRKRQMLLQTWVPPHNVVKAGTLYRFLAKL